MKYNLPACHCTKVESEAVDSLFVPSLVVFAFHKRMDNIELTTRQLQEKNQWSGPFITLCCQSKLHGSSYLCPKGGHFLLSVRRRDNIVSDNGEQ